MEVKVYTFKESEISGALKILMDVQLKYGFITEQMMDILLGHKMASYLVDKYTRVVFPLKNGMSHRILIEEARKKSFGKQAGPFDGIYGWQEIKAKLTEILNNKRGYVGLLHGASRVGKSLFMESLQKIPGKKVLHIPADKAESTPAGIIALVKQTYEEVGNSDFIVLVDEIDKIPRKDQSSPMLLRLFDSDETRGIVKNKATRDGSVDSIFIPLPNLKVFAGANDVRNIDTFLFNRFDLIAFPEYTEETFRATAIEMLMKKYSTPKDLAYEMASYFWKHRRNMGEVDMAGGRFRSVEQFRQWTEYNDRNSKLVAEQQNEKRSNTL
jgi:hypothetical protein